MYEGRQEKNTIAWGSSAVREIPPEGMRPRDACSASVERGHHVTREPAELLLELLRRDALRPVDHEVLEPRVLRPMDLIPSMTCAGGPQNHAFCLMPSASVGTRAGAPGVP